MGKTDRHVKPCLGLKSTKESIVSIENCASTIGSGTLDVYGTPAMIALMEECCHNSVEEYLSSDESTVGISIDVKHISPSPIGLKIKCISELTAIDGRILTFNVTAYDDKGEIGNGVHKRCIINVPGFRAKASSKLS